jgi:hypothetical protein
LPAVMHLLSTLSRSFPGLVPVCGPEWHQRLARYGARRASMPSLVTSSEQRDDDDTVPWSYANRPANRPASCVVRLSGCRRSVSVLVGSAPLGSCGHGGCSFPGLGAGGLLAGSAPLGSGGHGGCSFPWWTRMRWWWVQPHWVPAVIANAPSWGAPGTDMAARESRTLTPW